MGRKKKTIDSIAIRENINTQGLHMEIIAYRNCNDCNIKFEDGTIVYNKRYNEFREGLIRHPDFSRIKKNKEKVIGKISYNNIGEKMTVIDYRGWDKVTVEFDDGTKKNCSFQDFLLGNVSRVNRYKASERLGQQRIIGNETYEIVQYDSANNIKIKRLSDNVVFISSYDKFCKNSTFVGQGSRKKHEWFQDYKKDSQPRHSLSLTNRIGEQISFRGYTFKIVDYINADNIVIQCVENSLYKQTTYFNFTNKLFNVNFNGIAKRKLRSDHTGEISKKPNGDIMTIINYRGCRDFDVQFLDGTIVTAHLYSDFLRGNIRNPNNMRKAKVL